MAFSSEACPALDAGWKPVGVKKARQNKRSYRTTARLFHSAVSKSESDINDSILTSRRNCNLLVPRPSQGRAYRTDIHVKTA
jgi:hypothetical protein